MKYFSLALVLGLIFVVTSCSSMPKYRAFESHDAFTAAADKLIGKKPKEVVAILGKPMRAFYNDGGTSLYSIVYPKGNSEVSMTKAMFDADLVCYTITFESQNDFKFQGWRTSSPDAGCRNTKDEKINTSLID